MSEISQVLLTSFLTVLTATSILIVGQIVIRFIIEPLKDLRKLINEIQFALIFYANEKHINSKDELEEELWDRLIVA